MSKPKMARRLGVSFALAGMVFLSACEGSSDAKEPANTADKGSADASAAEPVEVTVAAPEGAATAPIYIAAEKGYYDEHGLDVTIVPMKASSDLPALMSAGDVQFGTAQPSTTFFNAAKRGVQDPVILATNSYNADTEMPGLLARSDLTDDGTVTDAGDLNNMSVGVIGPSTSSQFFAETAIADAGGDPSTVEFTVLGAPDMVSALSNDRIDAAWLFEPLASTAISEGIANQIARVGDVAEGFPTWLQASEAIISDNPDAVEAFVAGTLDALEFYDSAMTEDRREDIIDILVEYTAMSDPADWADVELPTVSTDGQINADAIEAFQQYLVDAEAVEEITPPEDYLEDSFRQSVIENTN